MKVHFKNEKYSFHSTNILKNYQNTNLCRFNLFLNKKIEQQLFIVKNERIDYLNIQFCDESQQQKRFTLGMTIP